MDSAIDRLADELEALKDKPPSPADLQVLSLRLMLELMRQLEGIAMSLHTITQVVGEQATRDNR